MAPDEKTLPPEVRPGSVWKHYKGGLYRVMYVALDETHGGTAVVYKAHEPKDDEEAALVFVRDLSDWHRRVLPTGGRDPQADIKDLDFVPRFTLVDTGWVNLSEVLKDTPPSSVTWVDDDKHDVESWFEFDNESLRQGAIRRGEKEDEG